MNKRTQWVQKIVPSPLGELRLVASAQGLAGVWFVQRQRHEPDTDERGSWPSVAAHPLLDAAAGQLNDYFLGQRQGFELPLDLQQGTSFQQSVWRSLLDIACGETTSYGNIAARIGRPQAVRAVGAAVGRNPLGIVVPCHRVVGAGGKLTGYAGGLDRKQALLLLERDHTPITPCLFS
jgi:methylated-DNA-[protein]-cysteine S-methyltransferase